MRFLDTRTGAFVERDPERTNFAILSHTWDAGGEQPFMKLSEIQRRYDLTASCPRHVTQDRSSSPSVEESPGPSLSGVSSFETFINPGATSDYS